MSLPMVAVVGTTGVGKSKLAVELAQVLDISNSSTPWQTGCVLNADAMQVYRGLDVITNKIPLEEQEGIQHSLMGFKEPGEQYVVGEWIRDALRIIEDCHERNALPIVVGGTLYWIQHLIFPDRLVSRLSSEGVSLGHIPPAPQESSEEISSRISQLPAQLQQLYQQLPEKDTLGELSDDSAWQLYTLLSKLDPEMAIRWHWKDSRKVLRSLEIIKERGGLASQSVRSQDDVASLPRMPSLIFWLYAEPEVLEPRLEARVDTMIKMGLANELLLLRDIARRLPESRHDSPPSDHTDSTTGIFQSIGYKEFSRWLSEDQSRSSEAFKQGVELMKLSTRQYAKKQVKWIRNRLIPAINAANELGPQVGAYPSRIFLLDATELGDKWDIDVKDKAIAIMRDFIAGDYGSLPDPKETSAHAARLLDVRRSALIPSEGLVARRKRVCAVCTKDPDRPVMVEEGKEWDVHVKTQKHRKLGNAEKYEEAIRIKREEARLRREANDKATASIE